MLVAYLPRKPISPPPKPLISQPISPTSALHDTANWKVYKSNRTKYQLQYPVNYLIFVVPDWNGKNPGVWQEATFADPSDSSNPIIDITVNVIQNVEHTDPSLWAIEIGGYNRKELVNTTLDGVKAVKVDIAHTNIPLSDNPYPFLSWIYVIKDDWGYMLQAHAKERDILRIFNQILSTFKFTDEDGQMGCTQDAKLCPDGKTYVGRQGPNCEFAACP